MFGDRIGYLSSGHEVFDRYPDSILRTKPPELVKLLPEILPRIYARNEYRIVKEFPFSFQTGFAQCVTVDASEMQNIYYARMEGRNGNAYSKFVYGRDPEPTKNLVVVLFRKEDFYIMAGFYAGNKSYPEPWQKRTLTMALKDDPLEIDKSWAFWKRHAFIDGYKPIQIHTVTQRCPWTKLQP